ILMTIVALLLSVKPVPIFNEYVLYLSFVPILFLGRYTNMVYTVLAAFIVSLVNVLIGDYTIITAMILIVIAIIVGAIGPFLKQNDIISLQILNLITLVIFVILSLISPYYEFKEVLYMIPLSFVLTITSSITFVDIWHFFSLVNRYENEDRFDYLTGLGNVKEFDRHLNETTRIAEDNDENLCFIFIDIYQFLSLIIRDENENRFEYLTSLGNVKEYDRHLNETTRIAEENDESLGLLLIDIDGFKDVNDMYSHDSGDAVLRQIAQLL